MVGVFLQDGYEAPARQEVVLAFAQVQGHFGAALRTVDRLDRVLAFLPGHVAFPAHALGRRQTRATCRQGHLVGDDERRVEADAELADQVRVLRLVAGQRIEELTRTGPGDRADVGYDFVARHADAVVGDCNRAGFRIE